MKVQEATRRETCRVTLGVLILAGLENGVYALLRRWTTAVLLGTLVGTATAAVNFFLLGLTVQKVAAGGEEKRGKQWMQLSHSLRMLLMGAVMVGAFLLPGVDGVAAVICLFFPQPVILALQARNGKNADRTADKEVD